MRTEYEKLDGDIRITDLVEGWETGNERQFTEGGDKWTEAGQIYIEIVEDLLQN